MYSRVEWPQAASHATVSFLRSSERVLENVVWDVVDYHFTVTKGSESCEIAVGIPGDWQRHGSCTGWSTGMNRSESHSGAAGSCRCPSASRTIGTYTDAFPIEPGVDADKDGTSSRLYAAFFSAAPFLVKSAWQYGQVALPTSTVFKQYEHGWYQTGATSTCEGRSATTMKPINGEQNSEKMYQWRLLCPLRSAIWLTRAEDSTHSNAAAAESTINPMAHPRVVISRSPNT